MSLVVADVLLPSADSGLGAAPRAVRLVRARVQMAGRQPNPDPARDGRVGAYSTPGAGHSTPHRGAGFGASRCAAVVACDASGGAVGVAGRSLSSGRNTKKLNKLRWPARLVSGA